MEMMDIPGLRNDRPLTDVHARAPVAGINACCVEPSAPPPAHLVFMELV
ncbi:hypothetical protein [Methanoregula sp.]